MSKPIKEFTLTDLSNRPELGLASDTTRNYSTERRGIMGDSPKTTKLIYSKIDYQNDWVTFYFLTEATEKYPKDYEYKDVRPDHSFGMERNPSQTYEIHLRFYGVSKLSKLRPVTEAIGDDEDLDNIEQPEDIIPSNPNIPINPTVSQNPTNAQVEPENLETEPNPEEFIQKPPEQPLQKPQIQPTTKASNPTQLSQGTVKGWLWSTDFAIWSNSPSFHWQGFNYNLSQLGASIYPTDIEPQVWNNVHGNALIDKHLLDLFIHIKFFLNQMSSSLLNKIRTQRESIMNTEKRIQEVEPEHKNLELWISFGDYKVQIFRISKYEHQYTEPKEIAEFSGKQVKGEDPEEIVRLTYRQMGNPSPHTQEVLYPSLLKAAKVISSVFGNPQKFIGIKKPFKMIPGKPQTADVRIIVYKQDGLQAGEVIDANKKQLTEKFFNADTVKSHSKNLHWEHDTLGAGFSFKTGNDEFSGWFGENEGTFQDSLMKQTFAKNKEKFLFAFDQEYSWRQRKDMFRKAQDLHEVSFSFGNDSADDSVGVTNRGNVAEVFNNVLAGIFEYMTANQQNIDILSFEAMNDSKNRANWYLRLCKEIIESRSLPYKLVIAHMDTKSSMQSAEKGDYLFFLFKQEAYDKVFGDPLEEEIKNDKVVCMLSSFSPLTAIHMSEINKVKMTAENHKLDSIIFVTKNENLKQDELTIRRKIGILQNLIPMKLCIDIGTDSFEEALIWLYNHHYKHIYIVAPNEKVEDWNQFLEERNKRDHGLFKFDSFKIISSGSSDPDNSERAQRARNAVNGGSLNRFIKETDIEDYQSAKALFEILRYELTDTIGMLA